MSTEQYSIGYDAGYQDGFDAALAEPVQEPVVTERQFKLAMKQWEDWKAYALELQEKLVKYEGGSPMILNTAPLDAKAIRAEERERICAAIKAEDDYCIDNGDYMLDSNDCIKVARGEWVRPEFDPPLNVESAAAIRGLK